MAKKDEKLTPAMKQFHHFKEKHSDAILFFRMGDFYETFYEDAQICSSVLGLTLTSRSKADNPIPLAGVPFHAVDGYIKKMIDAGYKVAVCEQVEDPKKAKGVVKRDVVRVITPGTLTDDMLLDEREDNYLCSFWLGSKSASLSWVDISTGHFFIQEVSENNLLDEILRISPKECLVAQTRGELFGSEINKIVDQLGKFGNMIITKRPGWYFDGSQAVKKLLTHFKTTTLEGFGIDMEQELLSPAGALLEYLDETQKTTLGHISAIKKVQRKNYLQLDQTTLRSLEILRTMRSESRKGSLLDCIDHTVTAMGGRMLKAWICMPLCQSDHIQLRQDAIEELIVKQTELDNLRASLKSIFDLERIAARISTYRTNPRDLLALAITLRKVPEIRELLSEFASDIMIGLCKNCDSMDDLADLLEAAIDPDAPTHLRDGGVIKSGFSDELDQLRGISKDGESFLAKYQQEQLELTGIDKLKIGYNRVFGYYIETPRQYADKVPANYVRKQTIKNAERYITEELKKYEQQVLGAQDKALELENRLFEQLRTETTKYISRLQSLAECLGKCDCLCGFAQLGIERNYVRPVITDDKKLEIIEGKHPVLADSLGSEFVPNDVDLCKNNEIAIITGPNMAGKSTYIRQTALLVLLAQTGCFIPAQKATIGVVDRIFTRVGASDELLRGQSTFMVEMTETANIVNNASDRSLVILDEIGRGTSTYDGLSLAWAITEHLANNLKCRTLFATHYHQLTQLSEILQNVSNCNVAVREWMDEIVFLHKIVPGGTDKSYGVHVAKLAGVPNSIIKRSREILDDLEATFAKEAQSQHFTRKKTVKDDSDLLFVKKNKSVLDKLSQVEVNNLTPIEAINLLNEIKKEMG